MRGPRNDNFDGLVKSPMGPVFVIPAKAGIQCFQWVLDSGFHRSDGFGTFYEVIEYRFRKYYATLDQLSEKYK